LPAVVTFSIHVLSDVALALESNQMKHFLFAAVVATLAGAALATDVGVSVSVGQPGFYGRIDIGNVLQPQLIYTAPMIIQPVPVGVVRQPIYLRVPPGHAKKWDKHCHRYNACGQPVYFVQENWYQNQYQNPYQNQYPSGRRENSNEHGDRRHEHGNNGHDRNKEHKKRGRDDD
jgi:hypothetical protein